MAPLGFDTILPADSVEFCPNDRWQNIFACGTYKLDDRQTNEHQYRHGQCLLFQLSSCKNDGDRPFRQIQAFDLPAVIDMKWCHRSSAAQPLLAIADSECNITLHEWQDNNHCLKQIDTIQCSASNILCLSLDWSNRGTSCTGDHGNLVVSLSNGSLCVLRPTSDTSMTIMHTWHAHDYEPWVAAWDYWDSNVIYSGGDDLVMKAWDIRQDFSQPIFTNKRFDAGVTSIQSHPHSEHLLAVGSYNNIIRIYDTRKPQIQMSEVNVGGGAWRVKWHPSPTRKNDLLVACMHDGFKVINLRDEFRAGEIVQRFDAHDSLAYGVDWSFAPVSENGKSIIGSCSFYDHTLHVWEG